MTIIYLRCLHIYNCLKCFKNKTWRAMEVRHSHCLLAHPSWRRYFWQRCRPPWSRSIAVIPWHESNNPDAHHTWREHGVWRRNTTSIWVVVPLRGVDGVIELDKNQYHDCTNDSICPGGLKPYHGRVALRCPVTCCQDLFSGNTVRWFIEPTPKHVPISWSSRGLLSPLPKHWVFAMVSRKRGTVADRDKNGYFWPFSIRSGGAEFGKCFR